ncbi:MAG: hypothetical protein ABGX23_01905 [Nautiliaceae bacterium]
MFEFIVVLVGIGILIFVGFLQIPSNIAFEDKAVLKSILYQKESNAMKYEVYGVDDSVCVYFDRDIIIIKYKYQEKITIYPNGYIE